MPSNTPLPAAQLLKLADELLAASSECNAGILCGADEWNRLQLAEEAYRAARAASPRTLEEVALARVASAIHDHREEQRHESDARRVAEDAIDELIEYWHESFERREHARRLAGEGGGE